jgi:hypothetical protein
MNFIYPYFLWALTLIAIPILIHILNLRKHQTVYFSNVNFLKRVKKESLRKSKWKQLIIMACRILMIALLVFAFSKPYKPTQFTEKQLANKATCIYIDNSYSMLAEGSDGIAIESARNKAVSIVNASLPGTKFALLTNDFEEKHARFYSAHEMIQLIAEVQETHNQALLSKVQSRFENMLDNFLFETDKRVYVISDFQKKTNDLTNLKPDTLISFNFVPVPINSTPNLFIDSCWHESPAHHVDQVEEIHARIVNFSDQEYYSIPVNLYINDTLKTLNNIGLSPGETKIVSFRYSNTSTGLQQGRIELSDYPIVYDNTLYFSYSVTDLNNALLVKPGIGTTDTRQLEAIFMGDQFISLDVMFDNRLRISELVNYSTIFLYELNPISSGLIGELKKFVESGGTLVVIPSYPSNMADYNSLFNSLGLAAFSSVDTVDIPIAEVDYSDLLYQHVFKEDQQKVVLPVIANRYRFYNNQNTIETPVLAFPDRTIALSSARVQKGKVYTFAFPFSGSKGQFKDHLLFMPTIYNMVLYSSALQDLYFTIGNDQYVSIRNPYDQALQSPVIKNSTSGFEYVSSDIRQEGKSLQLSVDDGIEAGLYRVYFGNDLMGGFAMNYNLSESDLTTYSIDEIKTLSTQSGLKFLNVLNQSNGNFSRAIEELDSGRQMWKIFIWLALLFLLFELLVIKFWDKVIK